MATQARPKLPFSTNNFSCQINVGSLVDTRFWSKVSAIKKTYGSTEYSDGQTNIKLKLPGAISYDDITLSRVFTEDDDTLLNTLITMNAKGDLADIFIQPMYRDGYYTAPQGGQLILKGCTLVSITAINEIDTIGDNAAMTEAVFSPSWITSNGSKKWWTELDISAIRQF